MKNLFEIKNLYKTYLSKSNAFSKEIIETKAINNVSFEIKKGEILGLVGESGCGKTTLSNILLKLLDPTSGEILFKGENILSFDKKKTKEFRKSCQMIFQFKF